MLKQREKLNIKHIIAITAGKGGVGKSTIASCIACELAAQGAKVGMLDADIYAPALPLIFDVEQAFMEAETDQHGRTTAFPVEKHGVKIASIGFVLNRNTAVAWRGQMLGSAFNMFLSQIEWGELDYLIVDTPPGIGDIQFNFLQQLTPDGVVLLTTSPPLSCAGTIRDADLFKQMNIHIIGIVENMWKANITEIPNEITQSQEETTVIEKLAAKLNLPVLGIIPFDIQMEKNTLPKNSVLQQVLKNITLQIKSDMNKNISNL